MPSKKMPKQKANEPKMSKGKKMGKGYEAKSLRGTKRN
jgi:hypothetical protein